MTSSHSPARPPSVAPMWRPIAVDPSKVNDLPSSSSTPSGTADSKKIPFWTQPGIVPFVNRLTNAENHTRFNKNKAVSGETTNEMLDKLRTYVKDNSGIEWTREQVKGKIQYAKKKYDAANKLRTTAAAGQGQEDTTLIRSRMLAHCPYFDQFHAVYSGNFARNPPPPPQHQSVRFPGDTTVEMESDPETDDIDEFEVEDDFIIESSREQSVASSIGEGMAPTSKRRKTEGPEHISASDLRAYTEAIKAIGSHGVGISIELEKERLKQITRRGQALEQRENYWHARWLEMERALDEKLRRREQEGGHATAH